MADIIDSFRRKVKSLRARFYKPSRMELMFRLAEIDRLNVATAIMHQKTFPQFKNYCAGKKLVVCGAGPTLKKYQPIEGAVHIALNRSFLYDKVDFDFIFAQDWDGIKMIKQELIDYRPKECVKLLGCSQVLGSKSIPEPFITACSALKFNIDAYIYNNGFKSQFVKDIEYCCLGGMPNVGLSVMQFALYMNPAELYIVGCDMSGAHFANGNNNKQQVAEEKKIIEKEWKERHDRLLLKWQELKRFASIYYPDTKIISVNPVGLRGIFEDIDQK